MRMVDLKFEVFPIKRLLPRTALTLILILSLVILSEMTYSLSHLISIISLTLLLTLMLSFALETHFNFFHNPIIILFAITFSFFLPINNIARWIVLGILSTFLILKQRHGLFGIAYPLMKSLNYVLAGNLALSIFSKFSRHLLEFLSFGYDNALHFSLFRDYRSTASFPFGFASSWATDFGLFKAYPSGQAAIWSFSAEPLIGNSVDPILNLNVFVTLAFVCLLGISVILWRLLRKPNGNLLERVLVPVGLSALIGVGIVGILFSNGFIPYALGAFILALLVAVYPSCVSSVERIFTIAASVFLLSLTTPSLVLFLSLPVLFVGFQELRILIRSRKYFTLLGLIVMVVAVLSSILWVSHKTTSSFGWRQILAGGGAQPPNLYEILIILSLFLAILYKSRRKIAHDILYLVSLSGLLSVGLFDAITIAYTGSIQYYAIKQCYVWLIFGAAVLCRDLIRKNGMPDGRFIVLSICMSFLLLLPLSFPRVFLGGFMGTLPNAVIHTLATKNWKTEVVDADVTFSTVAAEKRNHECLILRYSPYDSDLNSRWLNALTREVGITNDCFAGFWNTTPLTLPQLQDRLNKLHGPFVVAIDPGQAIKIPVGTSSKIRYLVVK